MTRQAEEFEEWMDMPDVEELPEGGPLAPWMKAGSTRIVPTAEKVSYVNGYTFLEFKVPIRIVDFEENLTRRVIGKVPEGMVGADYLPVPFAAIPVRLEEPEKLNEMAEYLEAIAREAGIGFARIEKQDNFPEHDPDVAKMIEEREIVFSHPLIKYVNAYLVNSVYGGPEEGGWWYNEGQPVASMPVLIIQDKEEMRRMVERTKEYLDYTIGWTSEYPLHSVLGADVFEIHIQDEFAEPFPTYRPYYE